MEPVKAADNRNIKLKTLKIHGNKELPKMLFIVPWKKSDNSAGQEKAQQLVLHSLYGDLFDPITPEQYQNSIATLQKTISEKAK